MKVEGGEGRRRRRRAGEGERWYKEKRWRYGVVEGVVGGEGGKLKVGLRNGLEGCVVAGKHERKIKDM